jgi:UDP-N-acetylglucosamine 2-epimerase (non-hydrolysing)
VPNKFGFEPASVAVILGTRPEIVKLGHIINLLGDGGYLIHTGQHYDPNLSADFFTELALPEPAVFLGVGGASRATQIGEAIRLLDDLFASRLPRAVVVQGDTNSVVAGAVAANAREIFLCHIEAGLRSHDRAMPEEHNRVIADALSDLCCAPTSIAVDNLAKEGVDPSRVVLTGNTIVEAVQSLLPPPGEREKIVASFHLEPGGFVLATFHRPENVDDGAVLRTVLEELVRLPLPVLLPLHPRSVASARRHGLAPLLESLQVVEPLGYRRFLALEAEAALIISDSGGIAEEVSVLKRPLVVVRRSTERPEVMGTFACRVPAGSRIGVEARRMLEEGWEHLQRLPSPYGDGTASFKSVEAIAARLA